MPSPGFDVSWPAWHHVIFVPASLSLLQIPRLLFSPTAFVSFARPASSHFSALAPAARPCAAAASGRAVPWLPPSAAPAPLLDSVHARTCLHHAAYYGHADCLRAILSAAQTTPVADSWGFARFMNVRDEHGATPLHLAARQGRPECVHLLLENGAIVSAPTGSYGFPGSTTLHLAARGGNLDCIRELLAWGADRLQRDSAGRIAYAVALKRSHGVAFPLKFIGELKTDAKALLEAALMEANREREKKILKGGNGKYSPPSPAHSDDLDACSEVEPSAAVGEGGARLAAWPSGRTRQRGWVYNNGRE